MASSLNISYHPGGVLQCTDEGQISGFIFLCNRKTKEDCYRYRVFGVPGGKMNAIDKIKAGMKLFLFDFDVRILYGVYEATSGAVFNLQSAAFDGNFPAQVGFKIYKDCLPLPENSFKFAIQNIYHRGKFKQELNFEEVTTLQSLFRPLTIPATVHQPICSPISGMPLKLSQSALDDKLQIPVQCPHKQGHYLAEMQFRHNSAPVEPQHSQNLLYPHYVYHGSSVNPKHTQTLVESELRNLSAVESLHVPYVPVNVMPHSASLTILKPQKAEQSVLPSQYASYGVPWDGSYGQSYQPESTVSDYSTRVQQAYLAGNYTSSHPDQYWRNTFSSENQFGSTSDYPLLQSQTENASTLQQIHTVQYYSPHSVPTSSHTPLQQQFHVHTAETS